MTDTSLAAVERALKLQEGTVLAREVHRLRGQLREAEARVDRLQAAHDRASAAEVHLVNAVAELRNEIGGALGLVPPHSFHRIATFVEAVAALRSRDEAAQAVVRDVQLISPSGWGALPAAVRESLDALVCAHGQAAAPADEPRPRVLTEQEGGPPNERYPDPPASERGCQAQIWPSWANWWVPCGSPVADGKCQVYGHPAPAEPVETEEAGR